MLCDSSISVSASSSSSVAWDRSSLALSCSEVGKRRRGLIGDCVSGLRRLGGSSAASAASTAASASST
jgi:hypothetical protein